MTTRARNPLFPLTAATLLFAAVCLAFAVLLTGYHFRYCWNPHSYERQIGFDYPKPFVQRVLVVVVAKMLVQLLHVHPKIVFVSLDILAFWLAGLLYAVYLAFYFPRRTCLLLAPLLYLIIPWVLDSSRIIVGRD